MKTDSSSASPHFLYRCCSPVIPLDTIATEEMLFLIGPAPNSPPNPTEGKAALNPSRQHCTQQSSGPELQQSFGKHASRGVPIPPGCYCSPSGHKEPCFKSSCTGTRIPMPCSQFKGLFLDIVPCKLFRQQTHQHCQ